MPKSKVISQKEMLVALENSGKRIKFSKKSGAVAKPRA
jgi:hypothetical protein